MRWRSSRLVRSRRDRGECEVVNRQEEGAAIETVSPEQVAASEAVGGLALPPRVQEALGELVNSAKEGLLALSVGVGLGVLAVLMEEEVDEVVEDVPLAVEFRGGGPGVTVRR